MSKSKNIQKQELMKSKRGIIITIILLSMIIPLFCSNPAIATSTNTTDTSAPEITPLQNYGEIAVGQSLRFKVTDETGVQRVYYKWNMRETGDKMHYTTKYISEKPTEYIFEVPIEDMPTEPGTYEFNIISQDANNILGAWKCIPVCVKNPEDITGVVDKTKPVCLFYKDEYPAQGQVVEQGKEVTFRAQDDNS